MMGDACASSTTGLAAHSWLGDRGGGDSGGRLSIVRRRTARGGGIGCWRGGGRGCYRDGIADKDCSLSFSTATSSRRSPSTTNFALC